MMNTSMALTRSADRSAESAPLRLRPHHHRRTTRPRGQVILQGLWGILT